jgi:hypothetical protein
MQENLKMVLDLVEDCGRAYKMAPEATKRAFNQALFERILVYSDGSIKPEFNPPYDMLVEISNTAKRCADSANQCRSSAAARNRCFGTEHVYKLIARYC